MSAAAIASSAASCFDQHVGFGGVRAAEDRARVGVDVADLVLVAPVASEVGAVAVVDEREDAAAHGDARLSLVPGLLPRLAVGLDLLALLHVQRLAALVVLERRALEVHPEFRRPLDVAFELEPHQIRSRSPSECGSTRSSPGGFGNIGRGLGCAKPVALEHLQEDLGVATGHVGVGLAVSGRIAEMAPAVDHLLR